MLLSKQARAVVMACITLLIQSFATRALSQEQRELTGLPALHLGDDESSVRNILGDQTSPLRSICPPTIKVIGPTASGVLVSFYGDRLMSYGAMLIPGLVSFNGVSIGSTESDVARLLGNPDGNSSQGEYYLDNRGRQVVVAVDAKVSHKVIAITVIGDSLHPELAIKRGIGACEPSQLKNSPPPRSAAVAPIPAEPPVTWIFLKTCPNFREIVGRVQYPPKASHAGIANGWVIMQFAIDAAGVPVNAAVLSSSDPLFEPAGAFVLQYLRCQPGSTDQIHHLPLEFHLRQ